MRAGALAQSQPVSGSGSETLVDLRASLLTPPPLPAKTKDNH